MPDSNGIKQVLVGFTFKQLTRLDRFARLQRISRSELIRRIVDMWLDDEEGGNDE